MPAELEVLAAQPLALARVTELVDAELWSPRQRHEWTVMLTAMVHAMDWSTGLVVGVTRERLAGLAGRSPTTVSRMWAWAQDTGLLARVEEGAPKAWLGTATNRAAAFVFVAPIGTTTASAQRRGGVDESGNHPLSAVGNKPSRDQERLDSQPTSNGDQDWPVFGIPTSPTERSAAGIRLLARAGLDPNRLDSRRWRGALKPWWTAGACVAGLLWAIDHHPDQPAKPRGDALRGAQDPIAVMCARLRPWQNRLDELPTELAGHRGDYRVTQPHWGDHAAAEGRSAEHLPTSTAVRAEAQLAVRRHFAELDQRRRANRPGTGPVCALGIHT